MRPRDRALFQDKASRWFAVLIVGTVVVLMLGTLLGLWIRFFWVGWVFAG